MKTPETNLEAIRKIDILEVIRTLNNINYEMEHHGVDIIVKDEKIREQLEKLKGACLCFIAKLDRAKSDEDFLITTLIHFGE